VVYCGYQIAAGTRHELPEQEGLAHLCEHATFKGTHRRTALQVANALERLGGELNAFTTKEDTTFYAAIGRDHLRQAVDVLTDIVFHSTYPQTELDKEIEVVCDEIESYNDSPAELIYDDFENMVFGTHPLGHNILGKADRLRQYTHDDVCLFAARHYRPDNAVFFAYGDVDFRRLVALCEKLTAFGAHDALDTCTTSPVVPSAETAASPAPHSAFQVRQLSTHQAHVMVGTRAFAYGHALRPALALLTNIIGGPGMNSRLNVSLRERRGLVYTVEALSVNYTDTGVWSVYFGCDPADTGRCLRLVHRELSRLVDKPLGPAQLAAAKRQIKGQIAIACDNREQDALDGAKCFLHHGILRTVDGLFRSIDAVTTDDLQQVARLLFAPDSLTTLIYK
jgi:predicted Zn-dependent peptidase